MVVVAPDGRVCRGMRKQPSINMRSALRSMCMCIAHVIPHGCKHFGAGAKGCGVTVSYCETFLSSSEASSPNQDGFTKPRLARIQRSKRRIASTWFCNVHAPLLSVEFADADTAQKAHYRPDTDNRSDNQCISNYTYCSKFNHLLYLDSE